MAASPFEGTWLFEAGDDISKYFEVMGANFAVIKAAKYRKPKTVIKVRGHDWMISILRAGLSREMKFQLDQQFYFDPKKRLRNVIVTQEHATKLVERQSGGLSPDSVIIREVDGDTLKITYSVQDITCVRQFRRERLLTSPFDGIWKFVDGDSMVDYMKAIGVKTVEMAAMRLTNPRMEIKVLGDEWHLRVVRKVMPRDMEFYINEEFLYDRKTAVKPLCKITFNMPDENTLVEVQTGTPNVTITRTVDDFRMSVVYETDNAEGALIRTERRYVKT